MSYFERLMQGEDMSAARGAAIQAEDRAPSAAPAAGERVA